MPAISTEWAAKQKFEPWEAIPDDNVATMLNAQTVNEQAVGARMAMALMHKSKEEMIADLDQLGDKTAIYLVDSLEEAERYYEAVHKIIRAALARLVIASGAKLQAMKEASNDH